MVFVVPPKRSGDRVWECGECKVRWNAPRATVCWLCDRMDSVEEAVVKPFADSSPWNPVAPS